MKISMPRRFLETVATTTSTAAALSPAPPMSRDSDVVVILAVLLCALICVGGLALVARCAWLRRNGAAAQPPPSPGKGVKKKVLLCVPTLSYQEAFAADEVCGRKMSSDCAICLTEFAEGDEIRVLPQCGHGFHAGCVDVWLGSHSSCPSCRRPLVVTSSARCRVVGDAMPSVGVAVADKEERGERKATGDASGSGGFLA